MKVQSFDNLGDRRRFYVKRIWFDSKNGTKMESAVEPFRSIIR